MPGTSSRGSQGLWDVGRYAGLGLQFALTMAVLGALGWWLDSKFGTLPWLMVAGIAIGAVGGMIRIVKSVPGSQSFTPSRPPLPDEAPEVDPWAEPEPPSAPRAPAKKKGRAE